MIENNCRYCDRFFLVDPRINDGYCDDCREGLNRENFEDSAPKHSHQSIDFGDGSYVSGHWKDDPETNEAVRAIARAGLAVLRRKADGDSS